MRNVNTLGDRGDSPLGSAVESGNISLVRELLSAGANPNSGATLVVALGGRDFENTSGDSLMDAASRGYLEIAKVLLAAGANVNATTKEGITALNLAATNAHPEVVKLLLAAKADPNAGNPAPLIDAVIGRDSASAGLLLNAGANPNVENSISAYLDSSTPVQHWETVGRHGPRVLVTENSITTTPLGEAVFSGQLPMVQLLLKYKADPNSERGDGPVIFDAIHHPDILAALLDAGADVSKILSNVDQTDGSIPNATPLIVLITENRDRPEDPLAVAKLLLDHSANPNAKDSQGRTALHWLVQDNLENSPSNFMDLVKLLLDHHADPNAKDNDGRTPLDLLEAEIGEYANASKDNTNPPSPDDLKELAFSQNLADLLRKYGAVQSPPSASPSPREDIQPVTQPATVRRIRTPIENQ